MAERRVTLSTNYLRDSYSSSPVCIGEPVLQVLGFEVSLQQQSTIIIRLSDQTVFIDCFLIGPYSLDYSRKIITTTDASVEFHINDLVRLKDFFSKIDDRRICKLRIIIRKIQLAEKFDKRYGYPSEVSQYFQNKLSIPNGETQPLTQNHPQEKRNTQEKEHEKQDRKNDDNKKSENNNNNNQFSSLVKIEEEVVNYVIEHRNQAMEEEVPNRKEESQSKKIKEERLREEKDAPLVLKQIIQGKDGYFVGRLLRLKMTTKETKDGSISVLFLGLVDRLGELVRVNMAGRMAIKQAKQLKKNKCYYIKGLQTFQTQKMQFPQIRLKDKDFKVMEVQQPNLTENYAKSYFKWDHEHEQLQDNESIDVIGVVDEIEDKASYPHANSTENREVVRIVVRNVYKTVKISFWAEQIKALKGIKLRKKQPIILEDIKKKKNMFLDFTYQSTVVKLDEDPELRNQLKDLLPQPEQREDPRNIRQLDQLYQEEHSNNKVRTLRVFLSRLQQNRIIYKLCQNCKRKVQKFSQICPECDKRQFYYKFNCQLQFADHTGSFSCVAFQYSAQKIFNKTASEINELSRESLSELIDRCLFQEYEVGIENKNLRLIVRNIENVSGKFDEKVASENMRLIRNYLNKK